MWEIRDFGRFKKNALRKIHRIKIHLIWISIRGEIKEQNLDKKFDGEERE